MQNIAYLKDRALMLENVRAFFKERSVLEVDCPLAGSAACIDLHIDLFKVCSRHYPDYYLHSSPEYFMKRLLSMGMGDIYQLAHVFRDEECSPIHNSEFMMAEWYRKNFSLNDMIEESLSFIELFLGKKSISTISYREAFLKYLNLDYTTASKDNLFSCLKNQGVEPYKGLENEDKDAHLSLILGALIEPHFKNQEIIVFKHYPASQAALAKTIVLNDGEKVGERFEIYYKGIELANGYLELTHAKEQLERLQKANLERKNHGKEELPIDYAFLKALEMGLPECSGVAIGFDRLMMLRHNLSSLSKILPFTFLEA
ncbi:MAG: EF-P lysine aminoacylase EpmA [Chlamydiales bacterium]|nr:EF-P lysine aminoacylase EpmA [Chlamydiales bacterium]